MLSSRVLKRLSVAMVVFAVGSSVPTVSVAGLADISNLQRWYAADAITGLADGAPVSVWPDISPAGDHATQTTPSARPTWLQSVPALNGKPAVRFGGVRQYLDFDGNFLAGKPYTVFIVEGRRNGNMNWFFGGTTNGTNQNLIFGYRNSTTLTMAQWANDLDVTVPAFTSQEFVLYEGRSDTTPSTGGKRLYRNGTLLGSNTNTTPLVSNVSAGLGGKYASMVYEGDLAEVIIFDRALNQFERQQVGDYLSAKYGLTNNYPNLLKFGQVSQFSSPDQLDLDGRFVYAVNFGDTGLAADRVVKGVTFNTFASDRNTLPPGITVVAPNQVAPWQTKPEFGSSPDANELEEIMADIRWADSGAGQQIAINANVTPGWLYKLQLLVSGNNNENRNWDIEIEGQLAVDEFNSLGGTSYSNTRASVYTYEFVAGDSQLNVVMKGNSALGTYHYGGDRNPIIQGFTLENLPRTIQLSPSATAGTFTGGDLGEGLDLDGVFPYAVNILGPATGPVRDVTFTTDTVPGVTVTAQNAFPGWANPQYGITSNDNNLETVMQTMRWSAAPNSVIVDLANLIPGQQYKLQLLFSEKYGQRGFDIFVDGVMAADDFCPYDLQGGPGNDSSLGVVFTYRFWASADTVRIELNGVNTPFGDKNPTLSAFTLEAIPEPSTLALSLIAAIAATVVLVRRRRLNPQCMASPPLTSTVAPVM